MRRFLNVFQTMHRYYLDKKRNNKIIAEKGF
jgi:hypothetical protein